MNIQLIDTGYFYADGGAMFGAIPKTAWIRRYPSNEANGCILAMRTLVVTTDDGRIILIDNGAGNKQLHKLSYYQFFDLVDLNTELRKRGIEPEMVTDMILTHLHFDHCGYTTYLKPDTQEPALNFPNATHWISKAQWENSLHPNPLEKDSYFKENISPLLSSPQLKLVDEKTQISDFITLDIFNGHTNGQLVPYIKDQAKEYVFAGDVIPLAASISPEWISAYDIYPLDSYMEKCRLLTEAVEKEQVVIFCHDAYTNCGTVKKVNDFYKLDTRFTL